MPQSALLIGPAIVAGQILAVTEEILMSGMEKFSIEGIPYGGPGYGSRLAEARWPGWTVLVCGHEYRMRVLDRRQ